MLEVLVQEVLEEYYEQAHELALVAHAVRYLTLEAIEACSSANFTDI